MDATPIAETTIPTSRKISQEQQTNKQQQAKNAEHYSKWNKN